MKSFNITIPELTDNTVQVFVNDKFIGYATSEQINKMRISIAEYISNTGDNSILDTVYFIGHKDTNLNCMGDEIKITVIDQYGTLSDIPWELSHTRRDLLRLIGIARNKTIN